MMKDRLAELSAVSVLALTPSGILVHLRTKKKKKVTQLHFLIHTQSRIQAEEDVAVTVDRDGFMESFFRRVGVTVTPKMRNGLGSVMIQDVDCFLLAD